LHLLPRTALPLLSPTLITNERHPSHPAYISWPVLPSQSDPEDGNSVFLRNVSIHFQD
jgi:hypothetical protein